MNQKGFPRNVQYRTRPKGAPFQFFRHCQTFSGIFFLKGSPFKFFWSFASEWLLKNPKGSPFQFFLGLSRFVFRRTCKDILKEVRIQLLFDNVNKNSESKISKIFSTLKPKLIGKRKYRGMCVYQLLFSLFRKVELKKGNFREVVIKPKFHALIVLETQNCFECFLKLYFEILKQLCKSTDNFCWK